MNIDDLNLSIKTVDFLLRQGFDTTEGIIEEYLFRPPHARWPEEICEEVRNVMSGNRPNPDRLLTSDQVKQKLGYRCRTNHVLRNLEKRGLLIPIRLNSKRLVYDPADVERLIQQGKGVGVS